MQWQSSRRYTYQRAVGRVVQVGSEYRILDKRGRYHPIDQVQAQAIRDAEEHAPARGRPALFGDARVEDRRITLPVRLWEKLSEPYSLAIAELVDKIDCDI